MEQSKSSRDIRQELSIKRWIEAKGRATIVAATGYGFIINKSRSIKEFIEL